MNILFPPPPPTTCCRRGLTSPPSYPPGNLRADIAAAAAPCRVVASKMMRRMCDVCGVEFTEYTDGRRTHPPTATVDGRRSQGTCLLITAALLGRRRAAWFWASHERMMHNNIYQVMFVPSSAGYGRRGRIVAGCAAAGSAVPERSTASRVTEGVRR